MFNHLKFKATSLKETINLYGVYGREDDTQCFIDKWTMKSLNNDVVVIGRKQNALTEDGCFSIARTPGGLEIGFYMEPVFEVFTGLKNGKSFDVEYYNVDPQYKYICQQLIKILKQYNLW